MKQIVRSKIIKIGNSFAVRVPGALLEQIGLTDEVEISVEADRLVIRAPGALKAGEKESGLLEDTLFSNWDDEGWS
jgi:antitoxin MazE